MLSLADVLLVTGSSHLNFAGMSAAGLPLCGICWERTNLHQTQASVEPSKASYSRC